VAHQFLEGLGAIFLKESARDILGGEERKAEEPSDFKTLVKELCAQSSAVR
jgi:hypothetical protein